MRKVFFFGTGYCAKIFANKVKLTLELLGNYYVGGFLDNDINKIDKIFDEYKVYSPDILKTCSCDLILIFLIDKEKYDAVYAQLRRLVPSEKIYRYDFPLLVLLQKNYRNNDDAEIKETLRHISKNGASIFNQFINVEDTYDEVKWDDNADLPYIDFTTINEKKVQMYYPVNYPFFEDNGIFYVKNLMMEQNEGSPHLYVKENHNIDDGDCLIDAGVCEGNFALKYIDIASYVYLFEMDVIWKKPLFYTFRNYENKVMMINKAVSDETKGDMCQIDDIVSGKKIDFIKMDIEGSELSGIKGAELTFRANNIKSSICSYHRSGDEKKIRQKLESYGYKTSVSEGYMLFLYSDDTWKLGDLRRGIVYGDIDT